jgi:hypothetical protein
LEPLIMIGLAATGWLVYRLIATEAGRRRDRELFGMTSTEAARGMLDHNRQVVDDVINQHQARETAPPPVWERRPAQQPSAPPPEPEPSQYAKAATDGVPDALRVCRWDYGAGALEETEGYGLTRIGHGEPAPPTLVERVSRLEDDLARVRRDLQRVSELVEGRADGR